MDHLQLSVAADVGGTFTDCFAIWSDQSGQKKSSSIKVLSTGIVRCEVRRQAELGGLANGNHLPLILPQELLGHSESKRLPDDFFRSAVLSSIDGGVRIPIGRIVAFNATDSSIQIDTDGFPEAARPQTITAGELVEIECGLEAPVLATRLMLGVPIDQPLPPLSVRLGTTRGTNALLTRTGVHTGLVITQGFGDLLLIGEQDRPELFDLSFQKPPPLTNSILEIDARMDADGKELSGVDTDMVRRSLEQLKTAGVETLAICLLHSYLNPEHELQIEQIARSIGFHAVSRSSEVAPLIKLVPRTETTTLDAYLNPLLQAYVSQVQEQFGGSNCDLRLMTSGGNLVASERFRGRDSVLSGPAGGVVGLEKVVCRAREQNSEIPALAIGLDMGGTSTDVSRFDGQVGRRYETRVAGLRVMTPMMDIHTVAAGGGSICDYQGGRLLVGPDSAGASPGPACYGRGGPLCVTDINLILGRLLPDRFPFPLNQEAAAERLRHVGSRMDSADIHVLAEGFLDIAVTHMAEAVRAITTARGVDARDHALVGFGGAAAQHLCRVAESLGMKRIIDHPHASILSAVGIGAASQGAINTRGVYQRLSAVDSESLRQICDQLRKETIAQLGSSGDAEKQDIETKVHFEVDCRYVGTDSSIELVLESLETISQQFHEEHHTRFGYNRPSQPIELVCVRCEVKQNAGGQSQVLQLGRAARNDQIGSDSTRVWCRGEWRPFQLFSRSSLIPGQNIPACSVIVSDQSTLIVEPNWSGTVDADGTIVLEPLETPFKTVKDTASDSRTDESIQLEIIARRLQSIADSMGEVLRRTAVSVNVKERLDFSCAVFSGDGTLVANAPHVPVHLGAMGYTVRSLMKQFPEMSRGDCYVSNDPYAGGSHLPDVTVVTPVFCGQHHASTANQGEKVSPDFFVASRAHHAEIGGVTPGSMPPMARSLAEEGVLIRGFALVRNGVSYEQAMRDLLSAGKYPSRNVDENIADLRAQIAAGTEGAHALRRMTEELSLPLVNDMMQQLLNVAAHSVARWIRSLPDRPMQFQDTLDDGTVIAVRLIREDDQLTIDFDGTAPVHEFGFNATESIVNSAILYVLRCFCDSNLPLCDGVMRNIQVHVPPGLLSPQAHESPDKCAAVVAGNVETSQRIVDVLLGAIGSNADPDVPVFRSVAASQGTMNNVLMGNETFGYYETIGGGSGATVFGSGADAVHTHMTNTRITDPEILETRHPVRLSRFSIRPESGGAGKYRGGNGIIREFEFLEPLTISLITGRRTTAPYGAAGGESGRSGKNTLIRKDASAETLDPSTTIEVSAGDQLVIETPGGGGWGKPIS